MQHRQAPLDVFVGRAAERGQLAEVVARVEAGQPWLVAIEGDPGVGKQPWCGAAWPRPQACPLPRIPHTKIIYGVRDQLTALFADSGLTPKTLTARVKKVLRGTYG